MLGLSSLRSRLPRPRRLWVYLRRELCVLSLGSCRSDLDCLVCSHGGAGTTMLLRALAESGVAANHPYDEDGLKHLRAPPRRKPPETKVLYLYSDPVRATASILRRGLAAGHALKLGRVPSLRRWSLEEYAEEGRDLLGINRHVRAWGRTAGPERPYPIFYLNFEGLWENRPAVERYLGTEIALPERRERESEKLVSGPERARLREIYRPALEVMAGLPDAGLL